VKERGGDVKTLAEARREFAGKPSPWVIGAGVLVLIGVRLALGDFGWADVIAAAALLGIYPFGEWAIHVYLLHMKPREVDGRTVQAKAARSHAVHHRDPSDLTTLLLEPKELAQLMLIAVPLTIAVIAGVWALATEGPPLAALVSAGIASYTAIWVYEWTHFLIHTAYVPRTRYYRAVWRNHRLHHFKNEHFWHGITNNFSDRALGTNPDQREVPRSATARTLGAGPTG
jgi:hypothetical protein